MSNSLAWVSNSVAGASNSRGGVNPGTGDGRTEYRDGDNEPVTWRTSLVVQGLDAQRDMNVPVVVGLVEIAAGGVHVALRVGDGQPVILPLQDANQLVLNLNETTAERLKITAEVLGDDHR